MYSSQLKLLTPQHSSTALSTLQTPNKTQLVTKPKSTTSAFKSPYPLESLTQRITSIKPHRLNLYTNTVTTFNTIYDTLNRNTADIVVYKTFISSEHLIQYISTLLIALFIQNTVLFVSTYTLLQPVRWTVFLLYQVLGLLLTSILYWTQQCNTVPTLYLFTNYKQYNKYIIQRIIQLCTIPAILLLYNILIHTELPSTYIQYGVILYALTATIDNVLLQTKHTIIQKRRLYLFRQALYAQIPQAFVHVLKYTIVYTALYIILSFTLIDRQQCIQLLKTTYFIHFIYKITDALVDIIANEYLNFNNTILYCLYTDPSLHKQYNCLSYIQSIKPIDKTLGQGDVSKFINLAPVPTTAAVATAKTTIMLNAAEGVILYCLHHITQLMKLIDTTKSINPQKTILQRIIQSLTSNPIYYIQYNQYIMFQHNNYYIAVINTLTYIVTNCTTIDRQYIKQSLLLLLALHTTTQQFIKQQRQNLSFVESNYIEQHSDQWNYNEAQQLLDVVASNINKLYNINTKQMQYELNDTQLRTIQQIISPS